MTIQNNGFPADAGQPESAGVPQPVPDGPPQPVVAGPNNPVTDAVAAPPPRQHVIRRTRAGGVWVALAISAVVLVLLLVFILENLKRADVSMFGAHADLPLGVAMLLSAAAGALIVIIPGTGRIVQLRRTARRHRRLDRQAAAAPAGSDIPSGS
jgi:uncharacterized integral membrane protein